MFRKKKTGLKFIKSLFWFLVVFGTLSGGGYYFTHHNAEGHILYKRLKAENKYVYDEINPRFLKTNPAEIITVNSYFGVLAKRKKLITAIWGAEGFPVGVQPSKIEIVDNANGLQVTGVEKIERLTINYEFGLKAITYVLQPTNWNHRAILYQHGYAGTFLQMQTHIQQLLNAGFLVALSNYINYGENQLPSMIQHPKFGNMSVHYDMFSVALENPIKVYVNPTIITLNHIENTRSIKDVNMLGFSAGGWITTLVAATDNRISKSFAVAAIYPIYLRPDLSNARDAPSIQLYGPLLQASNYLDMFVLAASGLGRKYTQIFNQYDRCCYRNRVGKLYEEAVQNAVHATADGAFEVMIDTTHADHIVSDWAMVQILDNLQQK